MRLEIESSATAACKTFTGGGEEGRKERSLLPGAQWLFARRPTAGGGVTRESKITSNPRLHSLLVISDSLVTPARREQPKNRSSRRARTSPSSRPPFLLLIAAHQTIQLLEFHYFFPGNAKATRPCGRSGRIALFGPTPGSDAVISRYCRPSSSYIEGMPRLAAPNAADQISLPLAAS